ncbi:hypothetical protein [Planktotalea arctica]|uniref:hypothetical protein n=1 Tax=Planktotalea arctica TaxID=1481893 RepID=UPI00321BFC1D
MKIKMTTIALTAMTIGTGVIGETNYDDPAAILAELSTLSEDCAKIEDGQSQTHIHGIKIIRTENICAIVMGQEIDERVRVFLEEENLPWAGVGLWVAASRVSE